MRKNPDSQSGFLNPRIILALALATGGALLAVVGAATKSSETSSPAGWSVVSSPNANVPQMFNDVACTSANDCWAVGSRYDSWHFQDVTIVEHWDGTSWSIVNSPNQGDADVPVETSVLNAVTCASASDCWAVGYYYSHINEQPLIEHWNGTSWSIATSADTGAGALLKSVTCVSASNCWAVGYYDSTYSLAAGPNQTLTERWDGTAWVIIPSANAGTARNNQLTGVTCASASDCWAVGYYDNGGVDQTLIERWNGTLWAVVSSPNTNSGQSNQLNGVTCASASDCWAAGNFSDQPLTAHWNGTTWTIVSSPAAVNGASLKSVACKSASECWAVGTISNVDQPFMQRWDGTSWGIVSSPVATSALNGVTCLSGGDCWAVGYDFSAGGFKSTLAQRWNGTSWSAVISPDVIQAVFDNHLAGVACASASDCWAVGHYNGNLVLIEHWDGVSWTIVGSPTGDAGGYSLNGVTCAGPSNCWAVGGDSNGQTLIERWDGTSWSIVGSPEAGPGNYLGAVTCTSASNCWAVGDYGDDAGVYTLIKRWNGTSWSIVNSPNVGTDGVGNYLGGVACSSASDCWAVGFWSYYDAESQQQFSGPIIERWNGTSWTIVPAPTIAEPNPTLASVACPSATDCWAVGSYESGFEEVQTLILRWNGTSWYVENSPVFGSSSWLSSIACPSPFECWGVGQALDTTGPQRTLIEQWDGSSWQINPDFAGGTFSAVGCTSAPECWAVGNDNLNRTLIELYTGTVPPLTNIVSRKVHGSAGTFDIDLRVGTPAIECRAPGATGSNGIDYKIIFSFLNNVTNCGSTSAGLLTSGPGPNQCTVNLLSVPNQQSVNVTLSNVLDSQSNTGNVAATMGVLIGDTTGNGSVNASDISQTKAQSGTAATATNFRTDVTVNGSINASDISTVKSKSGTALP